jgi:hypothetical protein
MLNFLVQTLYQPLFSNSFLFSNLFPSKSFLHQKATSKRQKVSHPKAKAKSKSPSSSFRGSFTPSDKQGGAGVHEKGHDIITGEICVSAFLNVNNLGDAAVLLFLICWLGLCLSWPTEKSN